MKIKIYQTGVMTLNNCAWKNFFGNAVTNKSNCQVHMVLIELCLAKKNREIKKIRWNLVYIEDRNRDY